MRIKWKNETCGNKEINKTIETKTKMKNNNLQNKWKYRHEKIK